VEGRCFSSAVPEIERIPYRLRSIIRAKFCSAGIVDNYRQRKRLPAPEDSRSHRYISKFQGEQKSKGEEKALAAVGPAEEANRYTWKLLLRALN